MTAHAANDTNGKANGVGASFASRDRDPLAILTDWIAREFRKGKIERFELVQRGTVRDVVRPIQEWSRADYSEPRVLAMEILTAAIDEAMHGVELAAKYAVKSEPGGMICSFPLPPSTTSDVKPAPTTADGALAMVVAQCRTVEATTMKFAASLFQGSLEERALISRDATEREEQARKRHDALLAHYEKELGRLNAMVDKLLDERVHYVDLYVTMTKDQAANQAEAQREERRAKMREELFHGTIKPILPMVTTKILMAFRGTPDKPAGVAPAPAAVKAEEPKAVTQAQADALWALINGLEPEDFRRMVEVLSEEKRALFFRMMDAFTGGSAA